MTSNIGSEYLTDGVTSEGEIKSDARDRVMSALRGHFRPEFLNRLDDIVLFKPLTQPEIERIVDLMFDSLRERLAARSLTLELTEEARRLIAEQGFDPVYGARPLRASSHAMWRPASGARCWSATSKMAPSSG